MPDPNPVALESGATLSWSEGPADAASFVNVLSVNDEGPDLRSTTSKQAVVIPDLAPLGKTLPSDAEYEWAVFSTTANGLEHLAEHGTSVTDLSVNTYSSSVYREIRTR